MEKCRVCSGDGRLLHDVCPLCDGLGVWPCEVEGQRGDLACKGLSMREISDRIVADLKEFRPVTVPEMDPELHYLAPHITKARWTALGDFVSAREKEACSNVDGSRWISLRLDGSGFSKAVRVMRRHGVLEEEGFSERFAGCMRDCLRSLMEKFSGHLGYTQSDEMVVFIPPAHVVRGEQFPHTYNGRVAKMTTLAAGLVTAKFVLGLSQLCIKNGGDLEGLAGILPHFDCRLGNYDTWEEAQALLIWRCYDCSVNGVSDAVYHTKGSGKQVQSLGRREKVEWLWKNGKLPLPRHQAYGTVMVRVKREVDGVNPLTGESVKSVRGVIECLQCPVLELVRSDYLFPSEEA